MANQNTQAGADALNQQIVLQVVDDKGVLSPNFPSVVAALADIPGSRQARFRLMKYKDPSTCVMMQVWVLCTAPEPAT